jgi:hypothetical protein
MQFARRPKSRSPLTNLPGPEAKHAAFRAEKTPLPHRRLHADAFGFRHPDGGIQDHLLAPAKGERFAFRAGVVKPGRTLTICEAQAFAQNDGVETLIATMTGTLMAMTPRG